MIETLDLTSVQFEIEDNVSDERGDVEIRAKAPDGCEIGHVMAIKNDTDPPDTFWIPSSNIKIKPNVDKV